MTITIEKCSIPSYCMQLWIIPCVLLTFKSGCQGELVHDGSDLFQRSIAAGSAFPGSATNYILSVEVPIGIIIGGSAYPL